MMTRTIRRLTMLLAVPLLIAGPIHGQTQSVEIGEGFMDHGVAVPISNHRGTVATVDGDGNPVVLSWLRDHRGCYSLLMVDALTGEAEQFETPRIGDDPFASVLSEGNRYYTHFGSIFMEFDPAARAFTFHESTAPRMAMSMTEGDDGTIWSATYPNSGVVSYNPATETFRDYGHLYEQNWLQYPRAIAVDDQGWVYVGVGSTASQILILNPESGEATTVIPEAERRHGSGVVIRYEDGKVYGTNGEQWYEFHGGTATKIDAAPEVARKPIIASSQGLFHRAFPTGHTLRSLDLVDRNLIVETPDGETLTHDFDYESEGAHSMNLATASDGTICGGTAFPMRFFSYDPRTDEMIDRTAYGQWNTIAPTDTVFFVGGYGAGYMLEWDPAREWVNTVKADPTTNPRFLAEANPDINRPHSLLVHPGGRYVILGGTPGYGLTGGALMFWDREAEEAEVITHQQLIPQHSVHSMVALPDGNILCGTTIAAGTGGEVKATLAELFILDIDTKQIIWQNAPMSDVRTYSELYMAPNGLIYGIADFARLFVMDPGSCEVIHEVDLQEEFGRTSGGQGPRIFVDAPDDRVIVLLARGIAELDLDTHELTMLARSPVGIQVGGAYLDGRIYFGHGSRIYSWPLPAAQ